MKRSHEQNVETEPETDTEPSADAPDLMQTRIIGGSETPSNRFPYAVSIQDNIGHFCGGSLIAPDMVLTAAHCQGGQYSVVIGRHDLTTNEGESIPMKKETPHPKYNDRTTDSDWMLILLERPTTVNVPFVKLNTDANLPSTNQDVTVMGWGDTTSDDATQELASALMSVDVNVISNQDCEKSQGTIGGWNENYNGQITDNMLCARDNGQDSCQGDSGGPLVVAGNDATSDVQVGVVSWGIGCASPDFPGVYSRVSNAYDWIKSEVCNQSSKPPAELCGGSSGGNNGGTNGGTDDGTDDGSDDGTDDYLTNGKDDGGSAGDDDYPYDDDYMYDDDTNQGGDDTSTGDDHQDDNTNNGDDLYDDDSLLDDDFSGTQYPTWAPTGVSGNDDNGSNVGGGTNDGSASDTALPTFSPTTFSATDDDTSSTNPGSTGNSDGNWATIVEEDFASGFGFFNSGGADAKWLSEKKDRTGVIDLQDGNGESSSIYSNSITDTSYSSFRVVFNAFLLSMEDDDRFCFDVTSDGGSEWTETKCWSTAELTSKSWHDDITVEFGVSGNAIDLKVRFRCIGSDNQDDVFIDKIAIQGLQ
jgi:trypsin